MGGLIGEIRDLISHITDTDSEKPFMMQIFSCHDINLLGMLYVLNAELVSTPAHRKLWRPYWPEFGTTISLEVMSRDEINVYLNTDPLPINLGLETSVRSKPTVTHTFTLEELEACYRRLNEHIITPGLADYYHDPSGV